MRTLLFSGPGGAGTTTVATAAAVRAARSGRRTVLVARQAPAVRGLDGVTGLEVRAVEPLGAAEELWAAQLDALGALLPHPALPPASSVVPLPGTEEFAVLAELARVQADVVVLDAGPLERATALLALPGALRWWLDQLLPPQLRVLGAVRTAAVRSGGVRSGPLDAALAAVPVVERLIARMSLADPATTEVHLVAPPRPAAVAALRTAATVLALHGQRPRSVLVRVLPIGGTGAWWSQRCAEQEAALAELVEVAPVHRVPEAATAPADVTALPELPVDVRQLPVDAAGTQVPAPERIDGSWQLPVPLPFAERGTVQLTRWGDDLVLTTGGSRRSLRLDPLLRRCRLTGARLTEAGTAAARLELVFVPDPRLWPAHLLPAGESAS